MTEECPTTKISGVLMISGVESAQPPETPSCSKGPKADSPDSAQAAINSIAPFRAKQPPEQTAAGVRPCRKTPWAGAAFFASSGAKQGMSRRVAGLTLRPRMPN